MERIGVFLSSNCDVDAAYVEAARQLGTWLGQKGKTLVYGGVAQGLMEVLAQAAKQHGGHVVGLVPQGPHWGNRLSEAVDVEMRCVNLADRKQTMIQESDILVALPGGMGTLDEVLSTVASGIVGEHSKKMVMYNVNHCWDSFLELVEDLERQHMIRRPLEDRLTIVDSFDQLAATLEA